MLLLWLMTVCGFSSCNNDDESKDRTPVAADGSAKVRIDSIGIPGNPPVFKFDYDSNGRVTGYFQENGWSNIYGADSVNFDYEADRIVARMSYLKEGFSGLRMKVKQTARFYLKQGRIVSASLPIGMYETLRDSVLYYYEADKLSRYEVYEVLSEKTPQLKYEQRLLWNDSELAGMTATRDSETIYETSFFYNNHDLTALLPYMSFDCLLDNDKTYMSVLANMGCFGMLPSHDLSEITVVEHTSGYQYKYQCQVSWNYTANGLPDSFDYKSSKCYKASMYEPEPWQEPDEDGWLTIQSRCNIWSIW